MPWLCTQIGAREHYAVPRSLHRRGALARLCTDLWATAPMRFLGRRLARLRGLAARRHPDLPSSLVRSFNGAFLKERLFARKPRTMAEEFADHERLGRRFAELVVRDLKSFWPRGLPPDLLYFGYDTGCLETLRFLKERGVPCVVDQVDPARVMERIALEESARRPGWQRQEGRIPESYFQRLESEWRLADRVVVNSEWTKEALISQGVPAAKVAVVPLCYEAPALPPAARAAAAADGRPFTILWLGNVNLLKGIGYFLDAARLLQKEPFRFLVYGALKITEEAVRQAPPNVEFRGPIPRSDLSRAYGEADVFTLPTLSDGFGLTQLEAMAHGLPVAATPNCGRVVTDGEDGLIVPAGNAEALAAAFAELARDRSRLAAMSRAARAKAGQFSLERLGGQLRALEGALLAA